jgi:hypothetical protein
MKRPSLQVVLILTVMAGTLFIWTTAAMATEPKSVEINLERPTGTMKMGDTPAFIGTVKNIGRQPLKGLVVYLSLVSLKSGDEHPVDLEDWSAQKAVRINQLLPGEINTQKWGMRLIQSGRYGIALTVVDPQKKRPIVSDLMSFEISPKPTLSSSRILPIAIGEPLLILILLGTIRVVRRPKA